MAIVASPCDWKRGVQGVTNLWALAKIVVPFVLSDR
jgi:hypothetical protein